MQIIPISIFSNHGAWCKLSFSNQNGWLWFLKNELNDYFSISIFFIFVFVHGNGRLDDGHWWNERWKMEWENVWLHFIESKFLSESFKILYNTGASICNQNIQFNILSLSAKQTHFLCVILNNSVSYQNSTP